MSRVETLSALRYVYSNGPVSLGELLARPTAGNCRLTVQQYFYETYGIYLPGQDIVFPDAYYGRGIVIKKNDGNDADFFTGLQEGDIIYAEKLRDSSGRKFKQGKEKFETEHERLVHLHLAIYLGLPTDEMDRGKPVIWHSTFIDGGTALWSLEKFCHYYKPEIAMRIIV